MQHKPFDAKAYNEWFETQPEHPAWLEDHAEVLKSWDEMWDEINSEEQYQEAKWNRFLKACGKSLKKRFGICVKTA